MESKNFTFTLKSGEKLYAWYLAPQNPKAIICLCHGWGEHSLRYKGWAERFAAHGYGFLAWDHIGHGQSEGKRGHVNSYQVFMEEINLAINKANEFIPGTPVVLYGHSMGGNIVINFALREQNPFKLIVATSPWLRLTKKTSPVLAGLVNVLNKVWPSLSVSAPLDAKGISRIDDEVKKYVSDQLNHGKITPRLLTEITSAGEFAIANAQNIKKAFLLIHGNADPITSYQASLDLSSKAVNCSFAPFNDGYHELHNDLVQNDVFILIKEWLNANIE
jgi:acylglycerol lipase